MMRDLDELLSEVLTLAPSCPEPIALRYLRDAAREFCARTELWRETDTMKVTDPGFEGICTFADARILAFEQPALDGVPLEPKTVAWLNEHRPGWSTDAEPAQAQFITQMQPNSFTLVPRQSGTLTVLLVLQPSRTAMLIPEFLVEDWGTQIGQGAAGRVLTMTNAEYANPQLGSAHLSAFQAMLDTESAKRRKGQQGGALRTKSGFF